MAGNLHVRQFMHLAQDLTGQSVDAGKEPALPDQVVAFSGTSANLTLDRRAQFVELHADNVCHYVFANAVQAATATNMRLPGDATVFKGIHRRDGEDVVLNVIEGT